MPYHVLLTPQGKRVGYIMISTFMDEDTGPKVAAALKDMSAGGALDGLIIDDRMNSGGALISMADTLSLFTDGLVGYVTVNNETFPLGVDGRNVAGSQKLPLVVLIDHPTASAGEIFAGILKDAGRAYLIGETTYGNVEMLSLFDFEDGSSALIAMAKFRPANHPGEDWEYTGIVPDMSVITVWDEITQETDPLIRYGLYYFDRN